MRTLIHSAVASDRPGIFAQLTITSIALLAITVLWGQFDTRVLDDVAVWAKPAKFALSFIVHFGTLAIIVSALSEKSRKQLSIAIAGGVMAVSFLAEMAYIFFQAAQAEHSHFNFSTPFHQAMYAWMGVGAVLLVTMPIVVAWVARRDSAIGPATRSGIWWGALTSFALTLVVAGYLAEQAGHFVGLPGDPPRVLPVLGWSTEVGDLRPAHFLSLHALQVIPLIGLWIDRSGCTSAATIKFFVAAYALLTFAVLGQSLLGFPLISI